MVVVKTITLMKALPLLLLVIVGLFKLNTSNLKWEGFPAFDKLGAASIILFFAFIGGETALNVSGEMKNPKRTAPLGLLLGVVSIIIFFSLIQIVAQSSLGAELNHQKAPLAASAGILLGTWSTTVLISCGVIAIFSSSYSLVLVFSRVLFAAANDGLMPPFLSKVNSKYSTPHMAIITYSLISFLIAISGGFKQLLVLATSSMLLLFVGVALAVIKFRLKSNKEYPASFTLPGGLAIPLLTLLVIIWFLFQSKSKEVWSMGIFLAVLSVVYALKIFFTKKEAG
ncbi:MAG: APC family permease, partial [Bacteroidota bacterium]